jgi:hypothetical protein
MKVDVIVRNLHYMGINPKIEISTMTLCSLVNICIKTAKFGMPLIITFSDIKIK